MFGLFDTPEQKDLRRHEQGDSGRPLWHWFAIPAAALLPVFLVIVAYDNLTKDPQDKTEKRIKDSGVKKFTDAEIIELYNNNQLQNTLLEQLGLLEKVLSSTGYSNLKTDMENVRVSIRTKHYSHAAHQLMESRRKMYKEKPELIETGDHIATTTGSMSDFLLGAERIANLNNYRAEPERFLVDIDIAILRTGKQEEIRQITVASLKDAKDRAQSFYAPEPQLDATAKAEIAATQKEYDAAITYIGKGITFRQMVRDYEKMKNHPEPVENGKPLQTKPEVIKHAIDYYTFGAGLVLGRDDPALEKLGSSMTTVRRELFADPTTRLPEIRIGKGR